MGVSLGDLSWNNPSVYDEYKRMVSKLGVPVFSVIGNHDHNEKTKDDTLSDQQFRDAMFRWGREPGSISSPSQALPLKEDKTTVLVNVFNWHTDWAVTISEDGAVHVSLLPNVKCYDPDAVRMLQYKNPWEKRPSAEPEANNDHMFLYTPRSSAWKTLGEGLGTRKGTLAQFRLECVDLCIHPCDVPFVVVAL